MIPPDMILPDMILPDMILPDEAATLAMGARIGAALRVGDAVTLSGPLGAGKTTLVRRCIGRAGWPGEVASPTFTLVIFYDLPVPILHIDLYRLKGPDQLEELGLDDARADHALLVEWPERMGDRIWADALKLTLEPLPDGSRRLTAQVPPPWQGRWPT